MSINQSDTQPKEYITTEAFAALGFTQVKSWAWVCKEHSLLIEHYGDFSDTLFSMVKSYYLSHLNNVATPVNGKEIASGNISDIVTAVKKIMADQS